jgi:prolyl oligopeptidase
MRILSTLVFTAMVFGVIAPLPASDDSFLWLEEVEDARALKWATERSAATTARLEARPEFEPIRKRTLEILDSSDRIPHVAIRGQYLYNFWQDSDHARGIWRRTTLEQYRTSEPTWETVLDIDALGHADGESWVWKGATCLAPDYRHCMVALSRGGGDAVIYREFDTVSKTFVEDGFSLPEAKSEVNWRDADHLWVGTDFGEGSLTDSGYPRITKLWTRGTPITDAETIFEGKASDVSASAWSTITPEGRYDVINRTPAFFRGEYFLRLGDRLVKLDLPDDVDFQGFFKDRLLISLRSDWTIADQTYPQDALLAIDLGAFLRGNRSFDLLFEPSAKVSLGSVAPLADRLLVTTLDNVRGRLYEMSPTEDGWKKTQVPLPGLGQASLSATSRNHPFYFFGYQDFLTPSSLWLVEGDTSPAKIKSMPAFFDTEGMTVTQNEAISADGTPIPYFLVTPKGYKPDGANPTMLYGYGGFEISETPFYSATWGTAWLERGGVVALANIRGGGEFGPSWHQAALKSNRHKAFEDFIAVAEDLSKRKITSPRHLGIMGGSNGGLLVGAVMTQRPELFNAVVCAVPLLDMKRYSHLLAGASWMGEYGNPDIPDDWAFIKTWSPYHNVSKDADYPEALFITSTRDDRVHPAHARKMVALLESLGHPVLYYENTEGGHATAADHGQKAKMTALEMTYLWMKTGE